MLPIADLDAAIKYMHKANEDSSNFKTWRTMDTGGDYDTHAERIKYTFDPEIIKQFENALYEQIVEYTGAKHDLILKKKR